MAIHYVSPDCWIKYNRPAITDALVNAKAAVLAHKSIPYQKSWVETLQEMQLKREVAGTSRIEGAEFTADELDAAMSETPEDLITRSQKQAHAAMKAYRWIARLSDDWVVNDDLVRDERRWRRESGGGGQFRRDRRPATL